jgi:single-strand DNA-binding protein
MADDINKVMLVGRLTRDAELMYTNSGFALCKFSLAVNRRRKQGEQWVDEANFFDINLWGRRGEALNTYLTKGTQLAIEGQLRQERWEQDGAKRSKITIEAVNVQLLGSRSEGGSYNQGAPSGGGYGNNNGPSYQKQPPRQSGPGSQSFESYTPPSHPAKDDYEDDIPF